MTNELQHYLKMLYPKRKPSDWLVDDFSWGRDAAIRVAPEVVPGIRRFRSAVTDFRRGFGGPLFHLRRISAKYESFNSSFQAMANEQSRILFAELLLMSELGEKRIALSSFSKDLVTLYRTVREQYEESKDELAVYGWRLRKVQPLDLSVELYTTPEFLMVQRARRLYEYSSDAVRICAELGDVVIDGGAGWGDTALCFADAVGSSGKVYSFDIAKTGVDMVVKQLSLNAHVRNVYANHLALSNNSDQILFTSDESPSTQLSRNETERSVETVTLDDFVRRNEISKVDFIKLDIEGSEVPALKGARGVIQRYKPKLAICVYHKWDDLREIPSVIHEIRGDYSMFLDCVTGFGGEAVLYCV